MPYKSKEKRLLYLREWRLKNKEYLSNFFKEYRKNNKEKIRERNKKAYEANKEQRKISAKLWAKKNREKVLLIAKANNANQKYPGKITYQDVVEIIERSNYKCCHCGKENLQGDDLTLEHLKRINDKNFISIACSSCNSARIPEFGPRKSEDEKKLTKKQYAEEHRDELLEYWRNYNKNRRKKKQDKNITLKET